jgi:hypothetical protein
MQTKINVWYRLKVVSTNMLVDLTIEIIKWTHMHQIMTNSNSTLKDGQNMAHSNVTITFVNL